MKKLVLATIVAAATGAAFAQSGSAECQLGASSPAYCNPAPQQPVAPYGWGDGYGYGYGNPYGYGNDGYGVPYGYAAPWGIAQARPDRRVTPYPRTARDRDGDGVRNRADRYPDDPRYR